MDIYQFKWTRLQYEIFRFLCVKAGQKWSLRKIAKALKKSPTAVSNSLKGLEKEELINIVKISDMNLLSIELNRNNPYSINMKKIENLKMVYESKLADFLADKLPGCAIILFGSYSLGEDVSSVDEGEYQSDMDIAIIGTKKKEIDLTEFNKKLERTIVLNFYSSFKEIHKHLLDNILNGILLSGSIDL